MDSVDTARQLWRQKAKVAVVLVVAALAAVLVAFRVSISPIELHKRALQVGAASSQILVDSPRSTLVAGASAGTFDALAARAKVYGEYLSSLQARARISAVSGVPARTITTSGPFSPDTGQISYENQTSESRAGELLEEGGQNRLVFTAQEGVPIITIDAQAATAAKAIHLARASFITLRRYVRGLEAAGGRASPRSVTVRQLGAPEGGTIGGSNDKILMLLAFVSVAALGFALVLILPRVAQRWRSLDAAERGAAGGKAKRPGVDGDLNPLQAENEPESANGASANRGSPPVPDDELADAPTERTAPWR